MLKLPEIFKQTSDDCASYAVSGVVEFHLQNQGSTNRVDVKKFYTETTPPGEGNTISSVLAKAKLNGIPMLGGTRLKLQDYTQIYPSFWQVKDELLKGFPLTFTYQVALRQNFYDGIQNSPTHTMTWPLVSHAMVLCDFDTNTNKFWCATSWGTEFGIEGYFWMEAMYLRMPYLSEVYTIKI